MERREFGGVFVPAAFVHKENNGKLPCGGSRYAGSNPGPPDK